ncbi:type I-F CRISPR-associated protein Csy2 [Chlorobium ferrooxidans]|nr:type I-F CRISPR-associated protein Csy2 [Chlorobium ferrooxidans]
MAHTGESSMNQNPDALLVLPWLRVQNANCISSPLTWGFPAMSAILGFVHSLERKLKPRYTDLGFSGVAVICHRFEPQIYSPDRGDKVFRLTRNPLNEKGESPSFAEEGRAHITISLLIQVKSENYSNNLNLSQKEEMAEEILKTAQGLRLAGGSILSPFTKKSKVRLSDWDVIGDALKAELRRLLPGFLLTSREDLLSERTTELQTLDPEATSLDALLDFSSLNYEPISTEPDADVVEWQVRKKPGWIVPIPVGYRSISTCYGAGEVLNARDTETPFSFVECIFSLGQWISPHRLTDAGKIFWKHEADVEKGLYRCICS